MVLLHFKIVLVLLQFQKCNVTAWDPADLTAQGMYERIFTASTLKNLWLFQAVCQSLLSGNALESLTDILLSEEVWSHCLNKFPF